MADSPRITPSVRIMSEMLRMLANPRISGSFVLCYAVLGLIFSGFQALIPTDLSSEVIFKYGPDLLFAIIMTPIYTAHIRLAVLGGRDENASVYFGIGRQEFVYFLGTTGVDFLLIFATFLTLDIVAPLLGGAAGGIMVFLPLFIIIGTIILLILEIVISTWACDYDMPAKMILKRIKNAWKAIIAVMIVLILAFGLIFAILSQAKTDFASSPEFLDYISNYLLAGITDAAVLLYFCAVVKKAILFPSENTPSQNTASTGGV